MKYAIIFTLLATPVFADEISWETKRDALMRAYEANGNSMVGWNTFDQPVRPVKTDKIPIINSSDKNKLDAEADDECERHGKKKVYRRKSWRCSR